MLSAKAKSKIVRQEVFAKFPYLVEITLDNGLVYRYANCDEDMIYNNNVYEACCFSITPPNRDNSSISDGTLTISAIDQFWIEKIRNSNGRAKIKFIACIDYNDNGIKKVEEIEQIEFILTNVKWNEVQITWTMMFDEKMTIQIPCDVATSSKVAGCR